MCNILKFSERQLMSCLLFSASLLVLLPVHAADPLPAVSQHPVIGMWNWTLFDGKCNETLQYRADGMLLSTSGEAVSQWRYNIGQTPDAKGFYKAQYTSTRQNGKKDCYGDATERVGTDTENYIQLSPANDRLIVCKSQSLAACYGPLRRQP